jgi:hypothetical protein
MMAPPTVIDYIIVHELRHRHHLITRIDSGTRWTKCYPRIASGKLGWQRMALRWMPSFGDNLSDPNRHFR